MPPGSLVEPSYGREMPPDIIASLICLTSRILLYPIRSTSLNVFGIIHIASSNLRQLFQLLN